MRSRGLRSISFIDSFSDVIMDSPQAMQRIMNLVSQRELSVGNQNFIATQLRVILCQMSIKNQW